MSRKDFLLVAKIIKQLPMDVRKPIALVFADGLREGNPNFNAEKFKDACGIG